MCRCIRVELSKSDSGFWFAWSEEEPGISGKGKTSDEAFNKFKKALKWKMSLLQ